MDELAVVAATAVGAAAGWLAGPVADAVATPRYGVDSPDHDPEDLALALLPAPTSPRARAVAAAVTAVAAGLLATEFGDLDIWLYFAALTWAYVVAAVVDLQYLRLPDVVTWPAAGVAVAGGFAVCARAGEPGAMVPGLVAGVAVAGFLYVFSLAFRFLKGVDALGLGDVKLQLSLGPSVGFLGWTDLEPVAGPVAVVVYALLAGLAAGIVLGFTVVRFQRGRSIPFGPFLMLGWFAVVLLADRIRA